MNEIVRFTLMPIIAAASGSCDVARIAFPCRVERTIQVRKSRSGIVVRRTTSLFHWNSTPPAEKTFECGTRFGIVW